MNNPKRDLPQRPPQRPDAVRGPARPVAMIAAPKVQPAMRPQAMPQGTLKPQVIPAARTPLPQPMLSRPVSPMLAAQEVPKQPQPLPQRPRAPAPPQRPTTVRPAAARPVVAPQTAARPPVTAQPAAPRAVTPQAAAAQALYGPAARPLPPRPTAQATPPRTAEGSGARTGQGAKAPAKIEDLSQIVRQLCDLLTKENAALKRHRTEEVKTFAERKESLGRIYQSYMAAIQRDPGPLRALDPSRRALLASQAKRLGELMGENAALLKGSILSINMYFKAVTDAVRERQEKMAAAYSRRGAMSGYIAKRSLAVSFNQTT